MVMCGVDGDGDGDVMKLFVNMGEDGRLGDF